MLLLIRMKLDPEENHFCRITLSNQAFDSMPPICYIPVWYWKFTNNERPIKGLWLKYLIYFYLYCFCMFNIVIFGFSVKRLRASMDESGAV